MTAEQLEATGPEREIALDMARLGLILGPVFLIVSTIVWRLNGLASAALAFGLVVANLLIGAWIIGKAASISIDLLMMATLAGFLARMVLLAIIVVPLRDLGWFETMPFAITLVGGHLGLLAWETQRISGSLAYPGLPPKNKTPLTASPTRSTSE